MISKEVLAKGLSLLAVLFLLSASTVLAQTGPCIGDLNCDGEVSGLDTILYKADYPRSPYLGEPCPEINPRCDGGQTCDGTLSTLGRWCDQEDGTVKDMTTGLVWLKDAGCMGMMDWYNAIEQPIINLRSGDCGLLPDLPYAWGDWRLPSLQELAGLHTGIEYVDSSQTQAFTNIQPDWYWASSTKPDDVLWAERVEMHPNKAWGMMLKTWEYYVWPVRVYKTRW